MSTDFTITVARTSENNIKKYKLVQYASKCHAENDCESLKAELFDLTGESWNFDTDTQKSNFYEQVKILVNGRYYNNIPNLLTL